MGSPLPGVEPATKADISLLRAEFAAKIESLEEIARLDKKIDRVASELVNTQSDIRDIRRDMATKDDVSRILNAIDTLANHQARLKTLESAQP